MIDNWLQGELDKVLGFCIALVVVVTVVLVAAELFSVWWSRRNR